MKKIKKTIALILITALMLTMGIPTIVNGATTTIANTGAKSGIDGNISWSISDTGTLMIESKSSSIVAMPDYNTTTSLPPWYSLRSSITAIGLKNNVKNIGNYAFYNCTKATTLFIGSEVATIGRGSFYYCSSLQTIANNSSKFTVSDNALYTKNFSEIILNASGKKEKSFTINPNTKTIRPYAFAINSNITSVTGEGITKVDDFAFINCTSLITATFSQTYDFNKAFNTLNLKAFYGCTSLSTFEIPPTLTTVGNDCFAKTTVTITGAINSYAQTYAKEQGLTFKEKKYPIDVVLYDNSKKYMTLTGYINYSLNLPALTKTGYTFDGWYSGGKNYYNTNTVINTVVTSGSSPYMSNASLTSRFTANQYTVTFNLNGGTYNGKEDNITRTISYDSAYGDLPTPQKENYIFAGWYDEYDNYITSETVYTNTNNMSLTAKYSEATKDVYFDANGGNCDVESIKVTYDQAYGKLPTPTRKGYTFAGWFATKEITNLNKEITSSTKYNDITVTTLYAYWVPVIQKVNNLKITYINKTSVKLNWNKVDNADGYEVYYKTNSGKYKLYKKATGTSLKVKKLGTKNKYAFKVRAYSKILNGAVEGPFGNVVSRGKTYVGTPIVKTKFYKNNNLLQLKWKKPANAKGYKIYIKKDNGKYKLVKTTVSKAVVFNTKKKTTYKVKVVAYTKVCGKVVTGKSKVVTYKT